ncbi:MAG: histidinol-phosphate transaminase [Chlamydiae bacterium]|nr:MAG: histidinol-phosphate transaminase [Chlamydiota bacterium]
MKWVRPQINNLHPYIPGKQVTGKVVKLNANENPYPPSLGAIAVLSEINTDNLRLYPDAIAVNLRKVAANIFDVDDDQIVIGNGSDDVLTMIIRTFLDVGDSISVVDPTYTLYETLAEIQGARTEIYPLNNDYSLPDSFFQTECKVIFLPNPNAQTGTLFPTEQIERLCGNNNSVVVIDEAYTDFSGVSSIPLIKKYDNLIVLRTVSKSYSLAGIRVGFGISNKNFISAMMKVKDSYNVNAVSQLIAAEAIIDRKQFNWNIGKIIETREWFSKSLSDLGWKVTPSAANFILVEPVKDSPEAVKEKLEAAGILIRHFNTPRLKNKLRISIGTDEQMKNLLKVIT